MGPLLAGIVILLLVFLLPLPYALYIIGIVVGTLLVLYGFWALFVGGPPAAPGTRRGVRWY